MTPEVKKRRGGDSSSSSSSRNSSSSSSSSSRNSSSLTGAHRHHARNFSRACLVGVHQTLLLTCPCKTLYPLQGTGALELLKAAFRQGHLFMVIGWCFASGAALCSLSKKTKIVKRSLGGIALSSRGAVHSVCMSKQCMSMHLRSVAVASLSPWCLLQVGTSVTTGATNTTVWGGIHQKTSPSGGAASHGWPDDTCV